MEPWVFGLVLLAAILHASWNALVKVGGDALVRLAIINATAGLCALPFLFVVDIPDPASWRYLGASALIHQAYYFFLVLSYKNGDLSHVYPIARGVAPLLVAIGAFLFAGETLSILGVIAVGIICAAIMSLSLSGPRSSAATIPDSSKAAFFALCTGAMIAGYTVCDGLGARAAISVSGYIAWLFVVDALPIVFIAVLLRRRTLFTTFRRHALTGTLGGAFSIGAYGLVIWAMSLTPMTYVSALRETSVILAALIGTRLLREPFGMRRIYAAVLVSAGVVLLQFSRAA